MPCVVKPSVFISFAQRLFIINCPCLHDGQGQSTLTGTVVSDFPWFTNKLDSHFNWASKTVLLSLLFWLKLISFYITIRTSFIKWASIALNPNYMHENNGMITAFIFKKSFKLYASSFCSYWYSLVIFCFDFHINSLVRSLAYYAYGLLLA